MEQILTLEQRGMLNLFSLKKKNDEFKENGLI